MLLTNSDWNKLVAEISPGLFRYFRLVADSFTSSDLVQEVLLRLVERIEQVDLSRGSPRMFAYGIARYVRLEYSQKKLQNREIELQESEAAAQRVFGQLESKQTSNLLRSAISKLSASENEIVSLYLDQDLQLQEIAELLEMPVGTVKSHLHRAKENLKLSLKGKELL